MFEGTARRCLENDFYAPHAEVLLKKGKRIKDISLQDLRAFNKEKSSHLDLIFYMDISDSMKDRESFYIKIKLLLE